MRTSDELIDSLLMYAELIGPDKHHPEFNIYHIETKYTGFSISARKVLSWANGVKAGQWEIRTWSHYNV